MLHFLLAVSRSEDQPQKISHNVKNQDIFMICLSKEISCMINSNPNSIQIPFNQKSPQVVNDMKLKLNQALQKSGKPLVSFQGLDEKQSLQKFCDSDSYKCTFGKNNVILTDNPPSQTNLLWLWILLGVLGLLALLYGLYKLYQYLKNRPSDPKQKKWIPNKSQGKTQYEVLDQKVIQKNLQTGQRKSLMIINTKTYREGGKEFKEIELQNNKRLTFQKQQ